MRREGTFSLCSVTASDSRGARAGAHHRAQGLQIDTHLLSVGEGEGVSRLRDTLETIGVGEPAARASRRRISGELSW